MLLAALQHSPKRYRSNVNSALVSVVSKWCSSTLNQLRHRHSCCATKICTIATWMDGKHHQRNDRKDRLPLQKLARFASSMKCMYTKIPKPILSRCSPNQFWGDPYSCSFLKMRNVGRSCPSQFSNDFMLVSDSVPVGNQRKSFWRLNFNAKSTSGDLQSNSRLSIRNQRKSIWRPPGKFSFDFVLCFARKQRKYARKSPEQFAIDSWCDFNLKSDGFKLNAH